MASIDAAPNPYPKAFVLMRGWKKSGMAKKGDGVMAVLRCSNAKVGSGAASFHPKQSSNRKNQTNLNANTFTLQKIS